MHGQCDATPTIIFPVAGHYRPMTGTKLYCLVTEAHVCEQLAQGCYLKAERPGVEPATVCVASQHLNHYATRQLMAITKTLLAETKWTTVAWIKCLLTVLSWWHGTVVERRSLTGELSLSCTWPAADGCPPMWVNRLLQVSQLGQLSLSSFLGR